MRVERGARNIYGRMDGKRKIMRNFEEGYPPEKYYEACITYHIVRYFFEKQGKQIYPFSISQIKEKDEGYDFGYMNMSEQVFFVQYKRPAWATMPDGRMSWEVDIEQLRTVLGCGIGCQAYYALPAFVDFSEWYSGLERTYFINAEELYTLLRLQGRMGQKTAMIREATWKMKKFEGYFTEQCGYKNILAEDIIEIESAISNLTVLEDSFTGFLL